MSAESNGALAPAAFGRFTFYLAVFAWLDALANLGTGPVAVQRTAGRPERIAPVLAAARRISVRAGLIGFAAYRKSALHAPEFSERALRCGCRYAEFIANRYSGNRVE